MLERVACYRSRETLSASWKAAGEKARAVAVEQSLPGPSVAPRVRGGGAAPVAGAAAAAVPAAAVPAADAPAPAPRTGADVSVSSAAISDTAVAEDASSKASPSSGGRRLLSA